VQEIFTPTRLSRITSTNTSSDSSLQLANQWLWTCFREHEECHGFYKRQPYPGWTPSRLVNVGSRSRSFSTRLLVGSEITVGATYMTLSHCWGTIPTLQLTKASLQNFRKCLPRDELPKTYSDAIDIARRLNVQWIWIDSLCIIQDSLEDWQKECSQMVKVYKNGVCNIAAIGPHDSRGGCYFQRNPFVLRRSMFKTNWGNEDDGIVLCRNECQSWQTGVLKTRLHHRAWVLQERVLAPRVLHFGVHMIYWECRRFYASEMQPEGVPHVVNQYLPPPKLPLVGEISSFEAHRLWQRLVDWYCCAGLTRSKDKLVAISGIAKRMQVLMNTTSGQNTERRSIYLAGLWSEQLAYHLLWVLRDPTQGSAEYGFDYRKATRLVHYRAPSWSWASVDGLIDYSVLSAMDEEISEHEGLLEVCCHEIVPVAADTFQQVRDGFVQVRGWLWYLPSCQQ
jgi:hypothetical protein